MPTRSFEKSLKLQPKLHALIPGGCHTYAKGDDHFPEHCPPYITKGKGCHVWDLDDNEYIEYGMGMRSVGLGHAYPRIVEAAWKQMQLGNNYSRPATIEVAAAETFLSIVPNAEMVKFAKNGSDATTAAIKLARAYTCRDRVAICGNHPFFSGNDWFIGTTAINAGIPTAVRELTLQFEFNNIESVQQLFDRHPDQIACFIMEPEKEVPVNLEFIQSLQQLCQENGSVFIFDEMITGFRWHIGGAQTLYQIKPDLSTFGKALGNGFAIAALTGKRELMELGGLHHNRERVFLMSATHGAENHSLAAAIAVIQEYKEKNVIAYLKYQGERLRQGMQRSISEHRLQGFVGIHGNPACLVYSTCDQQEKASQAFRTLFLQETVKRGLLAPNLVISFSHSDSDVDQTLEIIHEALRVYRKAIDEGVEKYLEGRPVQPVYRKWNTVNAKLSVGSTQILKSSKV